jgi:hypothetical protein
MKNRLFIASLSISAATMSACFGASSLVYDFESEGSGDLFKGGVAGWSQDSNNLSAFGQTFPLGYISSTNFGSGVSNTGHLGTQFANTADNSSTTLTGALDVSGLDPVAPSVTLNLAILDNSADNFPGRDAFSVALTGGSGQELAVIEFSPTVGDDLVWDIAVGVNGAAATPTLAQVDVLAGYVFIMNFDTSGTSFLYGPSQGTTSPVLISDEGAVLNFGSSLSAIEMTHDPLAAVGTSANTLAFDNIVVTVPEPTSALFLLLGGVSLFSRRRS